jgi:dTDP-4-amino-4,6-dideoxygalactose transaminase
MRKSPGYASSVKTKSVAAAAPVPFLDLGPSHESLKSSLLREISELIDSNAFTNGPQVREFEAAFAAYCDVEHCVGVASGLDGLRLALLAAGAAPGDEVVVPANTFVATLEAVTQAGCIPRIVDVGEHDLNIDPSAVASVLGRRTRFVMPVHLYGQLADMRALTELLSGSGIEIVEDACQAHGAERDGLRAGEVGIASAFSFYPGKNLGAFGDAGAVVTGDGGLAARVRVLREHGQSQKYVHEVEGWTSRLDTLQAIVLRRKLELLEEWNDDRRRVAAFYGDALQGIGDLRLPPVPAGSDPVWHLYVVRSGEREALAEFLRVRGIGTGLHYPQPVHLAPAYRHLGHSHGDFPVAERAAREVLSLPIFPGISNEQLGAVVAAVRDFFAHGR